MKKGRVIAVVLTAVVAIGLVSTTLGRAIYAGQTPGLSSFALIHFASIPDPQRLAVFFPGLLFGWVRAWRGGIGAAMLLHAMSNVLAEMLEKGWLS